MFISDLSEENVGREMYGINPEAAQNFREKVNTICEALLTSLETDPRKYFLAIISCLIKVTGYFVQILPEENLNLVEFVQKLVTLI